MSTLLTCLLFSLLWNGVLFSVEIDLRHIRTEAADIWTIAMIIVFQLSTLLFAVSA